MVFRSLAFAAAALVSAALVVPEAHAADPDCHRVARGGQTARATVYFDTGKTTIAAHHRKELERVAYDAKYQIKVCLIGQADRQGNPEFNKRLALKRAQAVRALLIDYGVPAGVLVPVSVGEAYGAFGGDYKDGQERRVEIHFPRRRE
ncbi:OmpA family protein [Caenispirillum salinarum]|uniref:OmpA family protein n=1 Tax=Caenispirillum salinarum TaxID=859058 RepID=UPI00384AD91B